MRPALVLVGLLLALLLPLGTLPATAHAPGSPPISREDSFQLGPVGQASSTFHVFLAGLGIPPDQGDTLQFSWSANAGLGPALAFDIHTHVDGTAEEILYRASAIRVDDSWVVPGSDGFMVRWNNTNPDPVNVTYRFQLNAPVDLSALIVIPIIVAVIVLLFFVSRRRPRIPG